MKIGVLWKRFRKWLGIGNDCPYCRSKGEKDRQCQNCYAMIWSEAWDED